MNQNETSEDGFKALLLVELHNASLFCSPCSTNKVIPKSEVTLGEATSQKSIQNRRLQQYPAKLSQHFNPYRLRASDDTN